MNDTRQVKLTLSQHVMGMRKDLGICENELGRRCGMPSTTINNVENPDYPYMPSLSTIIKIANALGVSVVYLLGGNND